MAVQSRLLQLPRELRDIIYEYALTEEGGLVAEAGSFLVYSTRVSRGLRVMVLSTRFRAANNNGGTARESNQLRYVCRQLHAETSTLSLRYNDVEFSVSEGQGYLTAYDLFDNFHQSCAPTHLARIRHITIFDNHTPVPKESVDVSGVLPLPLVSFCENCPNATVIMRFAWEGEVGEEADCMIHLSLALGHPNPFPIDRHWDPGGIAEEIEWNFRNVHCPGNLRFLCAHFLDGASIEFGLEIMFDFEYGGQMPRRASGWIFEMSGWRLRGGYTRKVFERSWIYGRAFIW